jgi:hypothetical protein
VLIAKNFKKGIVEMNNRELQRKFNDSRFHSRFARHWVYCLLLTSIPLFLLTLLLVLMADLPWKGVPLALVFIAEFLLCNALAWHWAARRARRDVRVLQVDYQPPANFPFD